MLVTKIARTFSASMKGSAKTYTTGVERLARWGKAGITFPEHAEKGNTKGGKLDKKYRALPDWLAKQTAGISAAGIVVKIV